MNDRILERKVTKKKKKILERNFGSLFCVCEMEGEENN